MSSYQIFLDGDTLQVGFDPNNPASGDRVIRDAETRLEELISSQALSGGELLKINGRMSLPVSYTIAHKLGHLYSAIAVFDPRLKGYVIVISTNPQYQLGDLIDEGNNSITSPDNNNRDRLSFLLDLSEDNSRLKVSFNSQVIASGDRIVKDTATQLDTLSDSGRLKGKLLKISGRASVLASFVLANKLAHCYGAIAIFEPKESSQGLDCYIVAISHSPDYKIGHNIFFTLH